MTTKVKIIKPCEFATDGLGYHVTRYMPGDEYDFDTAFSKYLVNNGLAIYTYVDPEDDGQKMQDVPNNKMADVPHNKMLDHTDENTKRGRRTK